MKVLWISAHPEARSLTGALRTHGVQRLRDAGHEVIESDLYAMKFNPVVTIDDVAVDPDERFVVGLGQETAQRSGRLSGDIQLEQDKVTWADTLVVQFPLWWFAMPAILKGWFDRVFTQGFAFGLVDERTGRKRRYGDNALSGKRAMVITSFGARESSMKPRGIHGGLDELLFPLHHGILWYAGISVVPPLAVAGADRMTTDGFAAAVAELDRRLEGLAEEPAIPFRYQDRGDYDDELVLRPHLAPGLSGPAAHVIGSSGRDDRRQ